MVPVTHFAPIAGTAGTASGAVVTLPGAATVARRIRVAWSGGPGCIALGGDSLSLSDAVVSGANALLLSPAAGTEIFELSSAHTKMAVASGVTVQYVLGV